MAIRKRYIKRKKMQFKKRVLKSKTSKIVSNILQTKRWQNLASVANLTVDGAQCVKTNGMLAFLCPSVYTAGTQVIGSGSVYFTLANLTAVSDYSNLFDRYKIAGVLVKITPFGTNASTEAANVSGYTQQSCIMHYCIDNDDSTLPSNDEAGINAMRQYPGYRSVNIYGNTGRSINIFVKPKVAKTVYAGLGTNSYQVASFPWIDMANQNAEGYGFKFILENVAKGTNTYQYFKIEACYYLKFRDPR